MVSERYAATDIPNSDRTFDLVIIGGGIVGATLACALRASGLHVAIVEANPPEVVAARDRAYAFSVLSGRIFEGLGIWSQIFPKVGKFRQIRLSDGDRPQNVVYFQTGDLGSDYLGYGAEHRVILQALYASLSEAANITWLCPAKVEAIAFEDDRVELQVRSDRETYCVKTRLIVGADGPNSRTRTAAGIGTRGWKYWQSCVTTVFTSEESHAETAFECFQASGPTGILPLIGDRSQVVWTVPHARAQALAQLDDRHFSQQLETHTGGLLGHLQVLKPRFVFPVQLQQSDRYIRPRLALIGDAAHCCHPVGGQGLNLGIRDAAALAQIIGEAEQMGEDIGAIAVLQRYERWRKLENLAILGFTDLLNRSFSNHWLPLVASRRLGLWGLRNVRPLKVQALQLMTGLKGRTPVLAVSNSSNR